MLGTSIKKGLYSDPKGPLNYILIQMKAKKAWNNDPHLT